MTLLATGELGDSVRMHPLAVPSAVSTAWAMLAIVLVTYRRGTPMDLLKERRGRWAAGQFLVMNVGLVVLWLLRVASFFGGSVPV